MEAGLGAVGEQVAGVETRLSEAIQAARDAGIAGDAAIQAGLDSLAGELGLTRADLLTQLGTTEAALRADMEAGLGAVGEQVTDLATQTQAQYDALSAEQKLMADALVQQGQDLSTAIQQAQTQTEGQIQAVADLLGKPARDVTQGDIDLVTQMMGGQRDTDLQYDTNRDGRIDQSDIDFLTRIMSNPNADEPWDPAAGTVWAPSGLYAQQAAGQREVLERLKQQEEAAKAEAEKALKAQRYQQGQTQLQNIATQLPQVMQQSMTTTSPIYTKIGDRFELGSSFESDLFGKRAKQTSATQPTQTKMAEGGYLEPESFEALLAMLNR